MAPAFSQEMTTKRKRRRGRPRDEYEARADARLRCVKCGAPNENKVNPICPKCTAAAWSDLIDRPFTLRQLVAEAVRGTKILKEVKKLFR